MLRTITALALATVLPLSVAAAETARVKPQGKAPRAHAAAKAFAKPPAADPNALAAALGTYPAKVEYASNDAPFVVFDVSPRKLEPTAGAADPREASLMFVATDVLSYVNVFMYSTSAQSEPKDVPGRTACGSKTPGHYSCAVPLGAALAQLKGGDGIVGLRIETEGLDGDRSTVRVTLPVKAASQTTLPAPSAPRQNNTPTYRHALSFIVDRASDVNRPAVHR